MLEQKREENFLSELYETDVLTYLTQYFKHSKKAKTNFFICNNSGEWSQKSYDVSQTNQAVLDLMATDRKDFYLSTSLHKTSRRTVETLASFPVLILDLDYYKTEFKELSFMDYLSKMDTDFFQNGKIPLPSAAINSGKGAYLVWFLKYTPEQAEIKRRVVMKIMYEMTKLYGADVKSLDPAHVFRIPNTYNTKDNDKKLVKAYFKSDLREYTLSEIAQALPNLYDVWKKDEKKPVKKEKKLPKGSKIKAIHKEKTLSYDYIQNVFKIAQIRKGDCTGIREMMCFLVRNYYHTMYRERFENQDERLFQESLSLALELNQKFKVPLKEKEIRDNTLNRKKLYRFKVETFNDWLSVSLEEQLQLKLKTKEASNERRKREQREKRKSVAREDYESNRQKEKEKHLEIIRQELKKNPKVKQKDLAVLLGTTQPRISQLIKEIKKI